jgi:hypothetical protein
LDGLEPNRDEVDLREDWLACVIENYYEAYIFITYTTTPAVQVKSLPKIIICPPVQRVLQTPERILLCIKIRGGIVAVLGL